MPTYRVYYAHENVNETDPKKRHGFATREIETDHEITTREEVIEIARQIGAEGGYTSVGITKTELKSDDKPGEGDVIEGEVVE